MIKSKINYFRFHLSPWYHASHVYEQCDYVIDALTDCLHREMKT